MTSSPFFNRCLLLAVALAATGVLSACKKEAPEPARQPEAPTRAPLPAALTSVPDARKPRVLAPELAPLPASPKRIISLAPVVTETVFAAGSGDRLVGVTKFCDRPPAAKDIAKVGGFTAVSLERILELKPDLVIAMPSMGQRQVLERLADHKIAVLVAFGDTIGEVRALIDGVTRAVATSEKATAAVAAFDASLLALKRDRTPSPKAIVVVSASPIVVAGHGTFANQALQWLGATGAVPADSPAWPTWSLEALGEADVDIVIAAGGRDDATQLRKALAPLGTKGTVVAAGRPILMRPGPHLAEDLDVVAQILDAVAATEGQR